MSIASALLTAAEFARIADPGYPQELVRGVIVDMPVPKPRHGKVCNRIAVLLTNYSDANRLGHVLTNDSGIITEQDPDSVRGADVAFIGYSKLPPDSQLDEYLTVAPDAIFEVRSPDDRWREILKKVAEYLQIGTPAFYVVDPEENEIRCYFPDRREQILSLADEFVGCGPLAGLRVPARFFE